MSSSGQEPPAMGERRARWGLGYQDKVATELILSILGKERISGQSHFQGVRLADLEAGKVDDFVLVWSNKVHGHSLKWSQDAAELNWGELIGANGLIKELAEGYSRLKVRWPGKTCFVSLVTNRIPSTSQHQNQLISSQSVHHFLSNYWYRGPVDEADQSISAAWQVIQTACQLEDDDFADFVAHCNLKLSCPQPEIGRADTLDLQHYKTQFEQLHREIATWITNQPESEFIDSRTLLDAIGHRSGRMQLAQRFPEPEIRYEKNEAAFSSLEKVVSSVNKGYIAVVGPAGAGKSTLVQSVLGGSDYPFLVPYFAYLPSEPGSTKERSEALTFFQDAALRLQKAFNVDPYSVGIADIATGREALRELFAHASELYEKHNKKTILLIDGLDHVMREVGLRSPILNELPDPASIQEGVVIVLGSQPQALESNVIPASVAHEVREGGGRRVAVDGLTRQNTVDILRAELKDLTSDEYDAIYDSSQGNPLILTYIINGLNANPGISIQNILDDLGTYSGEIEAYYARRIATVLTDSNTRRVVGLFSRAAPTLPVSWLQTWNEWDTLENILVKTLSPFLRYRRGNVDFLHNSLVSYLRNVTRSPIAGVDHEAEERGFYSELANRCEGSSCSESLGRSRVFFLQKAQRYNDVLSHLSSNWIRAGLEDFVPSAVVHPLILAGYESAWKAQDIGELLRLILLDYEYDQRSSRIEAYDLAIHFLELDLPQLALQQVKSFGQYKNPDEEVLCFVKELWAYAEDTGSRSLFEEAKLLYYQAKPLNLIFHGELINLRQDDQHFSLVSSWCDVALLFEPLAEIVQQVNSFSFQSDDRFPIQTEIEAKSRLFYRVLLSAVKHDICTDQIHLLLDEIKELGDSRTHFAAINLLIVNQKSGVSLSDLSKVLATLNDSQDFQLVFATRAESTGHFDQAITAIEDIQYPRIDSTMSKRNFGLTDLSFTIQVSKLRAKLGLEELPVGEAKTSREEAELRVVWAAREIGKLLANAEVGVHPDNAREVFRSLILFRNHSVSLSSSDWRDDFVINTSRSAIFEYLCELSKKLGSGAIDELKKVVLELTALKSDRPMFSPRELRDFASFFYREGDLNQLETIDLGLSNTLDVEEDDPMSRQEACLEIAVFLHSVGRSSEPLEWLRKASAVSAGAGSHKDYHMSYLAEWLDKSVKAENVNEAIPIIRSFASVLEVAGGRGQGDAISSILRTLMRCRPLHAIDIGIEFIERGVASVSSVLNGIVAGGAAAGGSSKLINQIYAELACMIDLHSSPSVATAVLEATPLGDRESEAVEIMARARTKALPSHRIVIARALMDVLIRSGITPPNLTKNLDSSPDDSSHSSTLYVLSSGEVRTKTEVAHILSDPLRVSDWNPNPFANNSFSWRSTLWDVTIQSGDHLEKLDSSFPYADYEETERFAWKSRSHVFLRELDRAEEYARKSVDSASEGSWFRWYDGAKKLLAYRALRGVNESAGLRTAKEQFGKDLLYGRLNGHFLLSDISDILEFLNLQWPSESVLVILDDYFEQVLTANSAVAEYRISAETDECVGVDESLITLLLKLVAFPVRDVDKAIRNVLTYLLAQPNQVERVWSLSKSLLDCVQLEYFLSCIHILSLTEPNILSCIKEDIQSLNRHESLGVRSIAKRICENLGLEWIGINDHAMPPRILAVDANIIEITPNELERLIGTDPQKALYLYEKVFDFINEGKSEESVSEFLKIYREVSNGYVWSEKEKFDIWGHQLNASRYLKPSALVGRETAMRLLGQYALRGNADPSAESGYDFAYPIYDPVVDVLIPVERPKELRAFDWGHTNSQFASWRNGSDIENWSSYPEAIGDELIIGEYSMLTKPEWGRPVEERRRGLLVEGPFTDDDVRFLFSRDSLTHNLYSQGHAQENYQISILNQGSQMGGVQFDWVAINFNFAVYLGWTLSPDQPFTWLRPGGRCMVRSVFWQDGWTDFQPPCFESLGKGWLLLATDEAVEEIRKGCPGVKMHLWVNRDSSGEYYSHNSAHIEKLL